MSIAKGVAANVYTIRVGPNVPPLTYDYGDGTSDPGAFNPWSDHTYAAGGTYTVTITDSAGAKSSQVLYTPAVLPCSLSSIAPNTVTAGAAGFTLVLIGTGFAAGAVCDFQHVERPAVFVNATRLEVAVTAADIATPGARAVSVIMPDKSVSQAQFLAVN